MNEWLLLGLVLTGVVVGAVAAWLLARDRNAAEVELAVGRVQAALEGEAALLRERLRVSEESLRAAQGDSAAERLQGEKWRAELSDARDDNARLSERALRVPALEAEVEELSERALLNAEEILRLSRSLAQKTQAEESLTAEVKELEEARNSLEARLADTSVALNVTSERKVAAETLAARLPELETQLAEAEQLADALNAQLAELREACSAETSRLTAELAAEQEAAGLVRAELVEEKQARTLADGTVVRLTGEVAELRTRTEAELSAADEKLALLLQAKEALGDQFKSLANDILEEKSKRFAEQNQVSLGQLLTPLKEQLTEFKGKVEEVYVQEGKDRTALAEQVRQLFGLNQTLSEDAKNLTRALKGSAKTQGNWGELVLERVLEASGLRKGQEYVVQDSHSRDDGTRAQPDVVILLPEERRLVVDSKVSLVAYEQYVTAETDEERTQALRRHLDSGRAHIKTLSAKEYQALYGLKSLDFVLMFVPIEPAFMLAVMEDNNLFMDAWNRNVLLVSPSTLLFVVRTVAHLWRQEAQSRNAQEIAKRGGDLYDKLVGFVEDLQAVGNRINQAQVAFESAQKKLGTGKGNVIWQAAKLRDMGVKPSKALPAPLVEAAGEEDLIEVGQLALLAAATTQHGHEISNATQGSASDA